jgi:hypothetical protein
MASWKMADGHAPTPRRAERRTRRCGCCGKCWLVFDGVHPGAEVRRAHGVVSGCRCTITATKPDVTGWLQQHFGGPYQALSDAGPHVRVDLFMQVAFHDIEDH